MSNYRIITEGKVFKLVEVAAVDVCDVCDVPGNTKKNFSCDNCDAGYDGAYKLDDKLSKEHQQLIKDFPGISAIIAEEDARDEYELIKP